MEGGIPNNAALNWLEDFHPNNALTKFVSRFRHLQCFSCRYVISSILVKRGLLSTSLDINKSSNFSIFSYLSYAAESCDTLLNLSYKDNRAWACIHICHFSCSSFSIRPFSPYVKHVLACLLQKHLKYLSGSGHSFVEHPKHRLPEEVSVHHVVPQTLMCYFQKLLDQVFRKEKFQVWACLLSSTHNILEVLPKLTWLSEVFLLFFVAQLLHICGFAFLHNSNKSLLSVVIGFDF